MKRRKFIRDSVVGASALTIIPGTVLSQPGRVAPSDKLNIAVIGAGGRGNSHWSGAKESGRANVVALVDVDDKRAAGAYQANPQAKRFKDYRKLESIQNEFDAVMIATPDHTHAVIGTAMMDMGKHAYIEKPLAHSIHEV